MPSLSFSYTLTDGTTADADEVMANFQNISSLLNSTKLDADNIQAGAITNALISASAAIGVSKLAAGTAGQVLLNNSTPTPTWTSLSGDVTVTSAGVTAIGTGKVVTAMIADGDVETAKINDLAVTTGKINDLAVTTGKLAADAVTGDKLADDSVDSEHYVDGSIDTAHIANAQITPSKLATGADGSLTSGGSTTTSTSFSDLSGGANPSVTATIGANGLALVIISSNISNDTTGAKSIMSFAVSGATTQAANDNLSFSYIPAVGTQAMDLGSSFLVEGLTAGSNTFTAKYRVTSGTGTFVNRRISVIPL